MPFGAIAGGLAAGIGGSLISGALSGGGGGTGATNSNGVYQYIPTNQPGMDTNFNNYYNQYGNTLGAYYGNVNPLATSYLSQSVNPYGAQSYQTGAGLGQNAYYGAAAGAQSAGNVEYGLGSSLANASQNWGLNGTELQQLQQQSADAANAQSYLRGTQNSPYGAATAANAIDQTNLAYAQQQAQTQAALAGAAGSLYGQGTQQLGAAGGYYGTGAALPYQAGQNILSGENTGLTNYYNTVQPYLAGLNQLQGNALQYLGYGNTANNTAAGNAQYSSSLYGGLGQQLGQAVGQGISNYYGSSGTPNYGFSTGSSIMSDPSSYDYYGSSGYGGYGLGY